MKITKKMKYLLYGIVFFVFYTNSCLAQTPHQHLRAGDKNYGNGDFTAAEESYRKALVQGDKTVKSPYNLGNAIYQQKRYDEALKQYENALTLATSPTQKATIHYNMGNTFTAQKEYQKGIESYKNALRLTPNDPTIQHNLSVAARMKQQQEKQHQQQKEQKEQKEKPPKNDPKQPEKQSQTAAGGNAQEEKPNTANQNTPTRQEAKPNTPTQETPSLKHEQARELLRIMDNEERKVQEKVHKTKGAAVKNGKDW